MYPATTSHWSETAIGTDSGATATHVANAVMTGAIHFVTHISGHTDTDSVIQILGGAAGTTVVWEGKIDISLEGFSFGYDVGCVPGVPGQAMSGKIVTSTADCQVNISGFSLP